MSNYLTPGIYSESLKSIMSSISGINNSVGCMVGTTLRGVVGVPVLITSWNGFLENFAKGLSTPFSKSMDLAYSVYGFFQNGGSQLYILRLASDSKAKATSTLVNGANTISLTAKDEGSWANGNLVVKVTANTDDVTLFDVLVTYNGIVQESFLALSNDVSKENYHVDVINDSSKFIKIAVGNLVTATSTAFTGGADGIADLVDEDYVDAFKNLNGVKNIRLLCVPGQTSDAMLLAIQSYCNYRGNIFPILDAPKTSSNATLKTLRAKLNSDLGSLYTPWIKVSDPLSSNGRLRDLPVCGHIMGLYSRIIESRGVWKAPAGVEAVVKGAVELYTNLTPEDTDELNPKGINALITKTGYGIVVWGAKSLSTDANLKYVSDILLDIYIRESLISGTEWAIFEPIDTVLQTKIKTNVEDFLNGIWKKGGLSGDKPSEAYYVKCDADLNTPEVVKSGKVICEVGYASKKPAEFIVFRFAHTLGSN